MNWKNEPNKRAIAIVRRSSLGQDENTSEQTQTKEINSYAQKHDLKIIKLKSIIETAYVSEYRKHYQELMNFALSEGVKHIIFYVQSRESRNALDSETNERLVKDGKIILHYASDNRVFTKETSDSDWLGRDLQTVINKNYSRENSTRVKAAYLTKLESGHWPYRHTPLGYRHFKDRDRLGNQVKGTSVIIVDPDERRTKLVRREFELRAEGNSYDEIKRKILTEDLVPEEVRSTYNRSTIEKRMKNPFYWGILQFLGHVEDEKTRPVYPGKHPLIIPKEILKQVELVNKGNNRKNKRLKLPSDDGGFFRGLITCGHPECERQITYERREKRYKSNPDEVKVYHLYRCGNSRGVHNKISYINEASIWSAVDSSVKGFAITEDFADEISKALNETHLSQQKAVRKQMEGFREAMESVRQQRRITTSLFTSGKLSERDYNDQIAMLEESERNSTDQLEKLTLLINDEALISVQKIFELSKNAKTLWDSMDRQKRLETFKYSYLNSTLTDLGNESGLQLEIKLHPVFQRLTKWNTIRGTGKWRRERDLNPRQV